MNKPKLLLVDDDAAVLKQLRWALEAEYQIFSASAKEEALHLASVEFPDIIALDVNLNPNDVNSKGGIEILEGIKSKNPSAKVIMITGNNSQEIARDAINKGAFDYYLKPVNINELKIILNRALYILNLEKENTRLTIEEADKFKFEDIVGNSNCMQEIFNLIKHVAPSEAAALITGESGTGKELAAKAIHYLSPRRNNPFVVINCGAIPENLLESELFGHEKGAFTDAYAQRKGKLEIADKGTVFLDEIAEMSLGLQVKILRFLQEKIIERVGGNTPIELNVKIVSATNRDLTQRIKQGLFREDLYYRLGVINIHLPALRERGQDIPILADYFLRKYKHEAGLKNIKGFTKEAKEAMIVYPWPGNVRELENKVRRAIILAHNSLITAKELGFDSSKEDLVTDKMSLKEARQNLEKNLIMKAIQDSKGNLTLAAKMLGVTRPTLYDLVNKYNIEI